MSWNYRIVRSVHDGTEYFAIHEVYYDEDGKPWAATENASHPAGETLNEMRRDFGHYQRALSAPVLEMEDFKRMANEAPSPDSRGASDG